jgi:hypothetical protein
MILGRMLGLMMLAIGSTSQAYAQAVEKSIEHIIRNDDPMLAACRSKIGFFVRRGLVSLKTCSHDCFGELRIAELKDLDLARSKVMPHSELRYRAFVEVPCRNEGQCVSVMSGPAYGAGCEYEIPVSSERKKLVFPVSEDRADELLSLVKRMGE